MRKFDLVNAIWGLTELKCTEKMVLLALAQFYNNNTKECYPSQAQVAKLAGVSRKTVNEKMRSLEAKGLIQVNDDYLVGKKGSTVSFTVCVTSCYTEASQKLHKNIDPSNETKEALNFYIEMMEKRPYLYIGDLSKREWIETDILCRKTMKGESVVGVMSNQDKALFADTGLAPKSVSFLNFLRGKK